MHDLKQMNRVAASDVVPGRFPSSFDTEPRVCEYEAMSMTVLVTI